jgi:hypothetical protein
LRGLLFETLKEIMKTIKTRLLISQCHTNCPRCKLPTSFKMFESGAGGDFETYFGDKTESYYRLDLNSVFYEKLDKDQLLSSAIHIEEGQQNLRAIPEQVRCEFCKTIFHADTAMIDNDNIQIEAIELK